MWGKMVQQAASDDRADAADSQRDSEPDEEEAEREHTPT
jgi:hypothetical protein